MQIAIRKLTPALAADYVRFFDETPHNHGGEKCYCVTWRSDASSRDGCHWYPTEAYDGDRVIGWCNANGNASFCVEYLRSFWNIAPAEPNIRVKSIFCFTVAPAYQHKGVASALLHSVCQDAAAEGYDFVEAYAELHGTEPLDFRGSITMYERAGFVRCGVRENKVVLRKALAAQTE